MKNYTKTNVGNEGRKELHGQLALTGAEISINRLPAGTGTTRKSTGCCPAGAVPLSTAKRSR